ncbi:MAG TPA: M23 family metallopeptidase [Anaerolineaceae bacterium]|nr:M23 family metallopeptidase [Anaerolineaceae bacterium]
MKPRRLPILPIIATLLVTVSIGAARHGVQASVFSTGSAVNHAPVVSATPTLQIHPNAFAQSNALLPSGYRQMLSPGENLDQIDQPTAEPTIQTALRPPLVTVPVALGPYDQFYFLRPFTADQVSWPEPDYRYGGMFFEPDIVHTGIDIDVPLGTPVLATAAGTVIWAGYGLFRGAPDPSDPYGLAVAIRHDFSFRNQTIFTVYAHLKRVDVVVGQVVDSGDQLGLVGDTGNTTGPHLHFEVRLGQNTYFNTRNPELWIAPPEGWGVIAGRVMDTNDQLLNANQVLVRPVGNDDLSWEVDTYGRHAVNGDDYYRENMVLSDLPAGEYEIMINYLGKKFWQTVQVHPGQITYFTFTGMKGFRTDPPQLLGLEFLPTGSP